MRLAKLILPLLDNEGCDLFMHHQQLQHDLLTRWGGFTRIETAGQWRSPAGKIHTEPSATYEVAMERADVTAFRDMAALVAKYAHQECVMIVTPCGDVEFVKPHLTARVAEA